MRDSASSAESFVHPKYRTVGLGAKLVRDMLVLAGTDHVEMSAVMAEYNPFAERAGMKKIVEQGPPKEAKKIMDVLGSPDFNTQLLGPRVLTSANKV
jgi:ABC-type ATPase with predicted acetyltransferase domain